MNFIRTNHPAMDKIVKGLNSKYARETFEIGDVIEETLASGNKVVMTILEVGDNWIEVKSDLYENSYRLVGLEGFKIKILERKSK